MPKPYQRIACYSIKTMEISHIGIPLYPTFFFPLRIRRESPFQYTSHSRTPSVLTVKEFTFNGRITAPSGIHGMQLFVSSKQNPFSHKSSLNIKQKTGKGYLCNLTPNYNKILIIFPKDLSERHQALRQALSKVHR